MFIVTKLIHIKYGYENELFYGLKQYYPSPGTNGCINIEFSITYESYILPYHLYDEHVKTQQDYHTWLSQKEGNETLKHKIQGYILSSKSNATYVH